jgi:hypothetical protein
MATSRGVIFQVNVFTGEAGQGKMACLIVLLVWKGTSIFSTHGLILVLDKLSLRIYEH